MAYRRGVLTAVIFDVDGTLAETERDGHRPAFNRAFAAHGLPFEWDVDCYGELLAVTGGRRRIEGYLNAQGHAEAAALAAAVHRTKTEYFVEWVHSGPMQARPGVQDLVAELRERGVPVAVATTGGRAWVEPLLARLFDAGTFDVVVTGDEVERLKPAPDAYRLALELLGTSTAGVLAVEDSPPGLSAARAAGLACVVVVNTYTRDGAFPGAVAVLDGFTELDVDRCAELVAG